MNEKTKQLEDKIRELEYTITKTRAELDKMFEQGDTLEYIKAGICQAADKLELPYEGIVSLKDKNCMMLTIACHHGAWNVVNIETKEAK